MDMSLPVIDGYEPRLQVFGFLNAYITVLKHAGCGVSFPVLYSLVIMSFAPRTQVYFGKSHTHK